MTLSAERFNMQQRIKEGRRAQERYAAGRPLSERERLERDIAVLEELNAMRPCSRCNHPAAYHGETHCGQDVCSDCDNPLHASGWCQCPAFVDAT